MQKKSREGLSLSAIEQPLSTWLYIFISANKINAVWCKAFSELGFDFSGGMYYQRQKCGERIE